MLGIVDSNQKYKIEKSQCYIGYKLLWIMKMYLEGRQFPFGSLPQEQWKKNVIKIARYVAMPKFTSELLDFDATCFLDVIQKLFYGEPFIFVEISRSEAGRDVNPQSLF